MFACLNNNHTKPSWGRIKLKNQQITWDPSPFPLISFSKQYFGAWTPQQVKDRVTEVLYGWTLWLKEEPKIQQAYSMLKKQGEEPHRQKFCSHYGNNLFWDYMQRLFVHSGIVKGDPKLSDTLVMAPPPQRTTESIFDQEDKAKVSWWHVTACRIKVSAADPSLCPQLLTRLLKSGLPEDLETANRLIKNTIKEVRRAAHPQLGRFLLNEWGKWVLVFRMQEQEKAEKASKRESTLKEVESCTKQLRELLDQHVVNGSTFQPSDDVKVRFGFHCIQHFSEKHLN